MRANEVTVKGRASEAGSPKTTRAQVRGCAVGPRVPIEEISRLVGHSNTTVTELVYRKQIRPVVESGATAMD